MGLVDAARAVLLKAGDHADVCGIRRSAMPVVTHATAFVGFDALAACRGFPHPIESGREKRVLFHEGHDELRRRVVKAVAGEPRG